MIIDVRGVTKSYGSVKALRDVSFDMNNGGGEVGGGALALLGANGAGKSTLLKCVLGITDFKGEICVGGFDVRSKPKEAKALMGYVPQEPLFYNMPVTGIVGFFARLRRTPPGRVREVLDRVGLTEHVSKPTGALSGGMKQRLSFAIAILSDPPVLVLDEPTTNLDAAVRMEMLTLVKGFKEAGKTVLFSSHRIDEVELLADRVLVMKSGSIVLDCAPEMLSRELGIKSELRLKVEKDVFRPSIRLLESEGFRVRLLNGSSHTIFVEVKEGEKLKPLKALLSSGFEGVDFFTEPTSMEKILAELDNRGSDRE